MSSLDFDNNFSRSSVSFFSTLVTGISLSDNLNKKLTNSHPQNGIFVSSQFQCRSIYSSCSSASLPLNSQTEADKRRPKLLL